MVLQLMSMFPIKYVLNNFKDLHSLKTGTTQSFSSKQKSLLSQLSSEYSSITDWLVSRNSVFKQNYRQHSWYR